MYACPHCNSTKMFLAYKEGVLLRVLEDPEDVEGLDEVKELLCTECNRWFPNPTLGESAHARELTGELVLVTGLHSDDTTIKIVATGITFPFHYDTYHDEIAEVLKREPRKKVEDILEFASLPEASLGIRAKEEGNPNTWLYRLDKKRVRKQVGKR